MKIYVYAICKNESQFADRWMDSMSEADGVYVLDTGSTDDTVSRLQTLGAHVTQASITPWRFDTARNLSLELVPEDGDICVCTDLDEVLQPGWRAPLEAAWVPGTGQARYRYTWSFLPDGSEGLTFWYEKIHARHGYQWVHPVHEVLTWKGPGLPGSTITIDNIHLEHHPDPTKSRGQYLPLLELSVAEDPNDDRNMHYLGREYMYRGRWEDCIATLKRHLQLSSAVWEPERCASMRYIAKSYLSLHRPDMARRWLLRAAGEAPELREPWVELAAMELEQSDYAAAYHYATTALKITHRDLSYISDPQCWGALPEDLAAVAAYYLGLKKVSLEHAQRAVSLGPENSRLIRNLTLIRRALEGPAASAE